MFFMNLEGDNMNLIGFINNAWYQGNNIHFSVSCKEKKDELYKLYLHAMPCVLQFGETEKEKCEYFNKSIIEGQLIKVRGKTIKTGHNNNILLVKNYQLLETRKNTFARLKRIQENKLKEEMEVKV